MTASTVLAGLLFGLSLIVVIGAQNAFVLQQGALRRHVGAVVLICAASDVLLIAAGVGGMGAALQRWPPLLAMTRGLGAALLLAYAAVSARRAARPAGGARAVSAARSLRAAIVACLAFTWLNPGVYLDTVVLLGSVADAHRSSRWSFATGAALASVLWFAALGFGAGLLAPLLARDGAARSLDAFVAAVMAFTAVRVLIAA